MPWPWPREPWTGVLFVKVDFQTIADFGIAADEGELSKLTAMICSGMPKQIEAVTAEWRREATNEVRLSIVDPEHAAFHQTFLRTSGELCVRQDYYKVHPRYQKGGNARRLLRALVHVYDDLGITDVQTYASLENGGYTWAAFGARAKYPDMQRKQFLIERMEFCIRSGLIDALYRETITTAIIRATDDDLMLTVARLTGPNQEPLLGQIMLASHSWDAYWDLADPVTREHLKQVLPLKQVLS